MTARLPAFAAYGIELEYMIVDRHTLDVRPIADELMRAATGGYACEVERGPLAWSNELVLHVLEIKNPAPLALDALPDAFVAEIAAINQKLAGFDARLLPSGMHPWMQPERETRLWPHDNQQIYQAYDRIFDCRRHGWANLQSMHVNLPFSDDGEFERLLAAVRLVLPILPALAASSPIADGELTGFMDYRMHVYRDNAAAFPAIAGAIIPEVVRSSAEHNEQILAPMYAAIAPHDEACVLQYEWLNSRGAIPRFDRHALEIRVLDMQESPHVDVALAALCVDLIRYLFEQNFSDVASQQAIDTQALANVLNDCVRDADGAVIVDAAYLDLFAFPGQKASAGELWHYLCEILAGQPGAHVDLWRGPVGFILQHGPLARRIVNALAGDMSPLRLAELYRELAQCLSDAKQFSA